MGLFPGNGIKTPTTNKEGLKNDADAGQYAVFCGLALISVYSVVYGLYVFRNVVGVGRIFLGACAFLFGAAVSPSPPWCTVCLSFCVAVTLYEKTGDGALRRPQIPVC